MPKKSNNPVWDYFKVSDEDVGKAVCILCKKNLSRGSKEPHKMTTTNLQNHLKKVHNDVHTKVLAVTKSAECEDSQDTLVQSQKSIREFCSTQAIRSEGKQSDDSVSVPSTSSRATEESSLVSIQGTSRQASLREILNRKELWQHDHPKAKTLTRLIGDMMCLDLQPYSIVEDKGFTRLLKHVAPNYIIPSRKYFSTKLTKVIPLMYETIKAKVKFELDQADFISLTSDGWTCQHTIQSFYSLTARFLTPEYKLRNVILQVTYFPESHTGVNIGKFLNESLQTWEIPQEKIHSIVTDNAANALSSIKESNVANEKHLPCVIHTMQLCIQNKLFKEQRAVSDTLAVFRALAGHFHHSSSGVAKLKEIQIQLNLPEHKLIQDVSTRWNSTYYMLERFCEQKKAVALYCITRSQTNAKNPTENQWKLAEMLVCILKHFETATKDMSADNACTSQIMPFIYAMEKFIDYACDTAAGVKTVVDELKHDFNRRFQKYKDNDHLKVAMMLDPRFKLRFVDDHNHNMMKEILYLQYFRFHSGSEHHLQVEEVDRAEATEPEASAIDTESDSEGSFSPAASDSDGSSCTTRKVRKLMNMDIYSFFNKCATDDSEISEATGFGSKKRKRTNPRQKTQSVKEKCMDEVNFYLSLPDLSNNECPYKWWGAYKYTCTTDKDKNNWDLARFSKKALCGPPSSVMSERLFSTTGNIFEAKRSRLLPEHGEQLAFLNYNMPNFMD